MIREATAEDVPSIVETGRDFYAASHWAALAPYDESRTAETLERLIEYPDAAVFISRRGLLGVVLVPLWCADVLTAQEMMFWADDGQGLALRRAAEAWATERNATVVLMGAHEPGDMERIDKWYRRDGYEPHGRIYRRTAPYGH